MHKQRTGRKPAVADLINLLRMLPLDMQMRIVISNPEAIGGNVTFMPRDGKLGNTPEILILDSDENINKALEFRYANTLGKAKSVSEFFEHVNKPYRLTVLHFVSRIYDLGDEYESILTYSWTSAEFPHQMPIPHLKEMFEKAEQNKLMTDEDRKKFNALPEEITIFRGLQDERAKARGLSWTTDRKIAEWFSQRWKSSRSKVLQATVRKTKVYMYCDGRNEREVVVNPSCLKNVRQIA